MVSAKDQHRINAGIEKHYLDDAIRDKINMTQEAHALQSRGLGVRAQFDMNEAHNAESWIPRRKRMLAREERLSR